MKKRNQLLVALIGAVALIIAAIITAIATILRPPPPPPPTQQPSPTSAIYHLNNSYVGSYTVTSIRGGSDPGGLMKFYTIAEDDQGGFTLGMTMGDKQYTCQGTVGANRRIAMACTNTINLHLHLTMSGSIDQDGHLGGTTISTDTTNTKFYETSNWSVQ
jgi:hypothetical protein